MYNANKNGLKGNRLWNNYVDVLISVNEPLKQKIFSLKPCSHIIILFDLKANIPYSV